MAALVAAACAQVGDRTAWLAAILADRYARPGLVLLMAALALAAASGISAAAGAAIGLRLTPEARQLMLAFALLLHGGTALFPIRGPERLGGWRLGAVMTSLLGLFVLAFGDGVQFIVATLAARSPTPAWGALGATAGATIGSLAVIAPAAFLGERGWTALPLRRARMAIGLVFLIVGAGLALGALRLV